MQQASQVNDIILVTQEVGLYEDNSPLSHNS